MEPVKFRWIDMAKNVLYNNQIRYFYAPPATKSFIGRLWEDNELVKIAALLIVAIFICPLMWVCGPAYKKAWCNVGWTLWLILRTITSPFRWLFYVLRFLLKQTYTNDLNNKITEFYDKIYQMRVEKLKLCIGLSVLTLGASQGELKSRRDVGHQIDMVEEVEVEVDMIHEESIHQFSKPIKPHMKINKSIDEPKVTKIPHESKVTHAHKVTRGSKVIKITEVPNMFNVAADTPPNTPLSSPPNSPPHSPLSSPPCSPPISPPSSPKPPKSHKPSKSSKMCYPREHEPCCCAQPNALVHSYLYPKFTEIEQQLLMKQLEMENEPMYKELYARFDESFKCFEEKFSKRMLVRKHSSRLLMKSLIPRLRRYRAPCKPLPDLPKKKVRISESSNIIYNF